MSAETEWEIYAAEARHRAWLEADIRATPEQKAAQQRKVDEAFRAFKDAFLGADPAPIPPEPKTYGELIPALLRWIFRRG